MSLNGSEETLLAADPLTGLEFIRGTIMSLSIGLPAPFLTVTHPTGLAADGSSVEVQNTQTGTRTGLGVAVKPAKQNGSGMGPVVDTLVDRLADLHERLRQLRQQLREALKSVQPDVVRLPRILSLQRQVVLTTVTSSWCPAC